MGRYLFALAAFGGMVVSFLAQAIGHKREKSPAQRGFGVVFVVGRGRRLLGHAPRARILDDARDTRIEADDLDAHDSSERTRRALHREHEQTGAAGFVGDGAA